MICDMDHEELEMFNESEEVKMAWQGMIASSKFSDRIKGWSSCVPMHQGSLEISSDNIVDLTNVTVPCDPAIYQESLCGVITYVDPMEKCMDINVTNNLVITPVYVNSSDCYQDHSGQCSTHIDFTRKGGNVFTICDYIFNSSFIHGILQFQEKMLLWLKETCLQQ